MVAWTLALAAFWTTRISALEQMYFAGVLFLSGQFVPLSLYPPGIQSITYLFPFRWMIGFPTELLLGRLTPADTAMGLAAQVGWLTVVLIGMRVLWRAGLRRYSAVGA